jgi:RNA polymerase sigma factor (sigma-70 family)
LLSALRERRAIDAGAAFVIIGRLRTLERRREALRLVPPLSRGLELPLTPEHSADEVSGETPSARWQRLMRGAQGGDQRAYSALLREAATFVRVIARRYHRDAGAVEDVVQETLISVHRIRHTYEPGRPVEPWIAAVAKARAIDALRSRRRRAAVETEISGEALADVADPSGAPRLEAASEIAAALATLPEGQRAAVRMLKIEEMSLAEASHASGQSVPALKSLLHRAMLSLRASLKGGGDA